MVVYTRAQLDAMSKEKLIEELEKVGSISEKINTLTSIVEAYHQKQDELYSELVISKKCNDLLMKKIEALERSALDQGQYLRREMIQLNPIPHDIEDKDLEETICKALSLTGIEVTKDCLQSAHRMKDRNQVIVKFTNRKQRQSVMYNRRKLKDKGSELKEIGMSDELYIQDSMSRLNQELFYKCRRLKKAKKIAATWFYNNCINVMQYDKGPIRKVFHTSDVEKILRIDNLDELLASI